MFIWRFAHNSLPVRRNLARHGIKLDTICPVSRSLDEDRRHIFFKCTPFVPLHLSLLVCVPQVWLDL
jgi:hypothetical protein